MNQNNFASKPRTLEAISQEEDIICSILTEQDWRPHWIKLYTSHPSDAAFTRIMESAKDDELIEMAANALTERIFGQYGTGRVLGHLLKHEDKQLLMQIMGRVPKLTYALTERWGKDNITNTELFEMMLRLPHIKGWALSVLHNRDLDGPETNYLNTYILPRLEQMEAGKLEGKEGAPMVD